MGHSSCLREVLGEVERMLLPSAIHDILVWVLFSKVLRACTPVLRARKSLFFHRIRERLIAGRGKPCIWGLRAMVAAFFAVEI